MEARLQALSDENALLVKIRGMTDEQKKRTSSKAGSALLPLDDSLLPQMETKPTSEKDQRTDQKNTNRNTPTHHEQVQERCMRCNEPAYGFMVFPSFMTVTHRLRAVNAAALITSPV